MSFNPCIIYRLYNAKRICVENCEICYWLR